MTGYVGALSSLIRVIGLVPSIEDIFPRPSEDMHGRPAKPRTPNHKSIIPDLSPLSRTGAPARRVGPAAFIMT